MDNASQFAVLFSSLVKIRNLQEKSKKTAKDQQDLDQLIKEVTQVVTREKGPLGLELVNRIIQKQEVGKAPQTSMAAEKFRPYVDNKTYQEIRNYAQLAILYEGQGDPEEHAINLTALFSTTDNCLNYLLQRAKNLKNDQPLFYLACQFTLPDPKRCDFSAWRKLAIQSNNMVDPEFRELLPFAPEIQNMIELSANKKVDNQRIKDEKQKLAEKLKRWKTLKRHLGRLNTAQKNEYNGLVNEINLTYLTLQTLYQGTKLAHADMVMLKAFYERYKVDTKETYAYFIDHGLTKQHHAKFESLKRTRNDINIPNIFIDGAEIGYPGFYFRKINELDPKDAAKAACLGKETGCCQSLSGELGEACVIHGLTSEDSGFYIVCKGDPSQPKVEDELYGQSWVWRGKKDDMVFDSIEISKNHETSADREMIRDFYRYAAYKLTKDYAVSQVNCGDQSGISKEVGASIKGFSQSVIAFNGSELHRDSKVQKTLALQGLPFVLFNPNKMEQVAIFEQSLSELIAENSSLKDNFYLKKYIAYAIQNPKTMKKQQETPKQAQPVLPALSGFPAMPPLNTIPAIKPPFGKTSNPDWRDNYWLELLAAKTPNKQELTELIEVNLYYLQALNNGQVALDKISEGAFADIVNERGEPALDLLILHGNTLGVKQLLQQGANPNIHMFKESYRSGFHSTPLIDAAYLGNKELTETLLAYHAEVNDTDEDGITPLMVAALSGNVDTVALLIAHGAKIDDKDLLLRTALMFAMRKNIEVVRLLLKHGATLHNDETSMENVIRYGNEKLINMLVEHGFKLDPSYLHIAVGEGRDDLIRLFATMGFDINTPCGEQYRPHQGRTPLMIAAERGKQSTVELLIDLGAEVDFVGSFERTALTLAKEREHATIIPILEAALLKQNKENPNESSVLTFSNKHGEQGRSDKENREAEVSKGKLKP